MNTKIVEHLIQETSMCVCVCVCHTWVLTAVKKNHFIGSCPRDHGIGFYKQNNLFYYHVVFLSFYFS